METIGDRVRKRRKLAGQTQQDLRRASGVSLRTIQNLEQDAGQVPRLETLHKLAAALRTTTSYLLGSEQEPGHGPVQGTRHIWADVRSAILAPPQAPDMPPPTLEGVRGALKRLEPVFAGDKFDSLAVSLPPLLRDAEALGTEGRAVRTRALQLAGWLMVQTRNFDVAEVALDRADDDATDPIANASTFNTRSWLLLRQGKLSEARELAIKWSDDLEPRRITRASEDQLAAWGWALLRLSAAAVRDHRLGEAEDALKYAGVAATALGTEVQPQGDFLRTFGPVTVAIKKGENASILGHFDDVLKIAETVPKAGLRPTSNNMNRHRLDRANAYAQTRHYGEAIELLGRVYRASPQWLPNQSFARDIVSTVVEKRRTLTPELRSLAEVVGLPA
ncbi:helix-turn-helix domain-containing protein [Streptomyces sp. BI20]|uniref:helix-turn-helix domain-containing protein n=1 Tax=Streptomyces sp. BI20 TaxID=3403460 RepID=UPI003C791D8E